MSRASRNSLSETSTTPAHLRHAAEPLWTFWKAGRTISCTVQDLGVYGVAAEVYVDNRLRVGRRFDSRDLAVEWAATERESTAQIYDGSL